MSKVLILLRKRSSTLWLSGSSGSLALALHKGSEEDHREHQAERTNNDVADGEEVVAASHDVSGRQHETLGSIEHAHIVEGLTERIVSDFHLVGSFNQILVDAAKQLTEIWQASSAHPHNKVLYHQLD
jgi:hypothetical protein